MYQEWQQSCVGLNVPLEMSMKEVKKVIKGGKVIEAKIL